MPKHSERSEYNNLPDPEQEWHKEYLEEAIRDLYVVPAWQQIGEEPPWVGYEAKEESNAV